MFPEVSQRRGSSYPEPVQPSAYRHFITAHPESPEVSYAKIFPAAFRGTLASVSNPRLLSPGSIAALSPALRRFETEQNRAEKISTDRA